MANRIEIHWPRIFAEGAAIVVSILLAFSIQAWWDNRQERADERIMLQAILDDIIAVKELLEIQRNFNEVVLESTVALLKAGVEDDAELSANVVDQHLSTIWFYNTENELEIPSVTALFEGGGLSGLSNPNLIQQFANLRWTSSNVRDFYALDQKFYTDTLTPFLISKVHLPQVSATTSHMPGDPESEFYYPKISSN